MSNKYFINETTLSSLGNKIRALKGDNIKRTPAQMVTTLSEIINNGINTNGNTNNGNENSARLITKNITSNGIYNANEDNADGYSRVNVEIPAESFENVIYGNKCELVLWGLQSSSQKVYLPPIQLVRSSSGNTGFLLITPTTFDVTNYNNLCLDLLCTLSGDSSQYAVRFGLTSTLPAQGEFYSSFSPSQTIVASNDRQLLKIDISSKTGNYYIGINGFGMNANIYSMYLE